MKLQPPNAIAKWAAFSAFIALTSLSACSARQAQETSGQNMVTKAEKPFASGGKIEMQLEGGSYSIRPAATDQIRVAFGENAGNAQAVLTTNGGQANVSIQNTPHSNFRATIEVPKTADLMVHLSGGELKMEPITGNKDVQSAGGDIEIGVSDPNEYSSVDASVKVGDLDGGPFGKSESGLSPHITWSGPGKYTLRATLGAGDLRLTGK